MPLPWPPHVFGASVLFAVFSLDGASKWLISGAPVLTYTLLLGASRGNRVLPFIGSWTLIATLNLFYAIAATSWLLYWVFAACCYPATALVCLCQFEIFARTMRRRLRKILRTSHFLSDKIAFFDLPALEIDTEVDGLMVIRGVTIHLSSLKIVAHGVEVGIKISDDMELSLQTEEVTIPLFRKIEIGDVFASIKGGEYEMSFGKLAGESKHSPSGPLMETDTPLLQAAEASKNELSGVSAQTTNGDRPQPLRNPASTIDVMTTLALDDAKAAEKYDEIIRSIKRTNSIDQSRVELEWLTDGVEGTKADLTANQRDLRAALCSKLHHKATIRHPPKHSVKVTTLQNMGPPWFKHFLHRLPLLYRLLLNPISYFHPLSIDSITAGASGKWIQALLNEKVFKHAPKEESETTRIEKRIHSWLSDANFVFELTEITGLAQVPILRNFDIMCILGFRDIMAYRTLPQETNLKQVIRLGGADATVTVPSFLLPHHEHWLPEMPSIEDQHKKEQSIQDIDGTPQAIQAKHDLKRMRKDETNVKLSAHVRLPACFDQELLDFIAAIIKATKVVEIERDMAEDNDSDAGPETDTNGTAAGVDPNGPNTDDAGSDFSIRRASTFKTFGKNLSRDLKDFNTNLSANVKTANSSLRDKMKRSTINAVANDRWIAKMVGKITKKLESAQGDVGYSGELPVALAPYRARAEQGTKLLS